MPGGSPRRRRQPVRIAIVNSYYYPDEVGGAERSVRQLAETAVAHGHDCTVFTTGRNRQTVEVNGVRVERFARPDCGKSSASDVAKLLWHACDTYRPALAAEMVAAIERSDPLIVHTNNLSGISVALWARLKSIGLPIAHTLRDYYLMCPNTARFRGGQPCRKTCSPCRVLAIPRLAATRQVDTVIGNSRFILQEHLATGAFPNARREVIYNGYRPAAPVSARAAVPGGRSLTIGYIGRLVPAKGLELLIDAFRSAARKLSRPICLHIAGVGDAKYVARLRELAHGLPVRFRGHLEPQAFYGAVDITVVPSLWDEPLARVLFESFAHGIPVLASAKGGSTELVVSGRTGWLFDAADPKSLESSLLAAVYGCASEKYRELSTRCLAESRRFLPERTLEAYIAALQSTCHPLEAPSLP